MACQSRECGIFEGKGTGKRRKPVKDKEKAKKTANWKIASGEEGGDEFKYNNHFKVQNRRIKDKGEWEIQRQM